MLSLESSCLGESGKKAKILIVLFLTSGVATKTMAGSLHGKKDMQCALQ